METLAVVGLVGNIIQFVEFSSQLISKSVQLYQSSEGALTENMNMETAANHLILLNSKLENAASDTGDKALEDLCKSCSAVAVELLEALDKLKVHGGKEKGKAIRKALRSLWSREKVQEIEKRLEYFREELNLHIVVGLREKVTQSTLEVSAQLKDVDATTRKILDAIINQQGVFHKQDTDPAEQKRHLTELPCAGGAAFNSRIWEHESQCLPDTRVDILEHIMTWSKNPNSACIFWLSGMAGTGKSTIARTVAHKLNERECLGASFFFSRGRGDLGHAGMLFTTLAAQLANTLPALRPYICRAIAEKLNISQQGLAEQWKSLIFQPLSNLNKELHQSQIFGLVIDALDECEDEEDIRLILRLLAQAKTLKSVQLRIFVTSRPETPIRLGFYGIPEGSHQDYILHNISPSIVDYDISVFYRHKLQTAWKRCDPPEHQTIELLVKKAGGLFIWAATACRFINEGKRFTGRRLSLVLQGDTAVLPSEKKLDEVYTTVLKHSASGLFDEYEKGEFCKLFKETVGSIVVLFDPLTAANLARLLNTTKEEIDQTLDNLHSVLEVPESQECPIRLLHPSFCDFLLDEKRCWDQQFWVDKRKTHHALAQNCLRLMFDSLKTDICDLHLPGTLLSTVESSRIEKYLPPELQYACRYWVQHLQQSETRLDDNSRVHTFLREHLLHWLETLSLIGKISDSVQMVTNLQSMAAKTSNLHAIICDARRFILYNRSIIEEAPLQLYSAALVFAPKTSIVRGLFLDQVPKWICRLPEVERTWSSTIQILEGHSDSVWAVTFSPDGQLLASASYDETVKLWDTSTGALRGTLEGHSGRVRAVAFSPNGQLLASASNDSTVRLWDAPTGVLRGTLKGHSDRVGAVAFSPDIQLLASASDDSTVRLWDASTGVLRGTLKGHSDRVGAVAFSPDGQLLASASDDSTVRLWDAPTGALRDTIEGRPSYRAGAVAFSPDGQLLAFTCGDTTITLWDTLTRASRGTLEGHIAVVSAVAFSPDGQLLASASFDSTVRLWDASTGASHGTLKGHSAWVHAVAFSPDGQLLASASVDKTIRLWDLSIGVSHGSFQGRSDYVHAVSFSPNGQRLICASDEAVRLWNTLTGVSPGTLKGHSCRVISVAVSLDRQLIAPADDDRTVRLWDALIGVSRGIREDHLPAVRRVVVSPDGQLLASAPGDETVRLWDASTGMSRGTLQGHSRHIITVAFSPDSQLLASASFDSTVRLWDVSTGASRHTLEGHSGRVRAVTFSPDGQLLASASRNTARLWDVSTGALRGTTGGHSGSITAVAFSLDGQLLASASDDETVKLWDIWKKETIQILSTEGLVYDLSFSNDGSCLKTERGLLEFQSVGQPQSDFSPYLYLKKQWVACRTENILWIPADYRPKCLVVRDNILGMGYTSGQVTFIEFDLANVPLGAAGQQAPR